MLSIMQQDFKLKIEDFLTPCLNELNAYLVDVTVGGEGRGKIVTVLVDTESGISIQQCAQISRALGRLFDAENLIDGPYRLEVSSPGIDKPIKLLRQFKKCVGRKFSVQYTFEDKTRSLVGRLELIEGNVLHFSTENQQEVITLDFSTIIDAREVLPW
ncbi:MAG: ribosome maturation factor RimP [Ignavibacteriales bacterium]|nr:ribosome maturation factor RimP [Ignavibacteriales bacterium]